MELILIVILLALIFCYINGFHDTANAVATVVSTKVLTPRQAVMLAASTNLIGALLGTAVAITIASGLVDGRVVTITSELLVCALLGSIVWNLITWWFGLPSSSSHALIGGLCGAALAGAHNNWKAIIWVQPDAAHWLNSGGLMYKVIVPLFSSPLAGFLLGFFIMGALYALIVLLRLAPRLIDLSFGKAQILSAGAMGLMHGTNDAQKTMGIIALALMAGTAAGTFDRVPGWMRFLYYPEQGPAIYDSLNRLGEMARDGRGLPQNLAQAIRDFHRAAAHQNAGAQYNLARLHLEGRGVPVNYKQAVSLMTAAAHQGHYAAQTNLARLFQEGSVVPKDETKAAEWLARAATNQAVSAMASFRVRALEGRPEDAQQAVGWLKEKAAAGHADAQINLGAAYASGQGIAANPTEALKWFNLAAARQHPDALYNLGLMHWQGMGLPRSETEAAKWFHAAAKTEGIRLWIKILCALVMAAGTAAGGWRIIKTLGYKVAALQPVNGFVAETSSAAVIFVATTLGIPVSTTHNISAAIMGVGCARRLNALKWPVVERMFWAWILTLPVSGGIGYALVWLFRLVGWIK